MLGIQTLEKLTGFFIFFFQYFMGGVWTSTADMTVVLETLAGFSLGAELIDLKKLGDEG